MISGFDIVDAYCTPGPTSVLEPGRPYSLEDLTQEHRRFGINRRVCLHAESGDGVPEEGNRQMSFLAEAAPGTAAVWTALPPARFHAQPVAESLDAAAREGVAAFAMFPKRQLHLLNAWANAELFGPMSEAHLPLYLDADQTDWQALYEVARDYPSMPVVLWNAGYRTDRCLIPIMDRCPNLYVGLAPRFVQSGGVQDFCSRYEPGRLIYASGWPAQSPGPLISLVTYALIDDDSKQAILSGNVLRMMGEVAWPVRGLEAAR